MIFLDVTSAASSPMNMGVHRMARGLYAILKERAGLVPVRWDFLRRRYATLSAREQAFVDDPFARYERATGTPAGWEARQLVTQCREVWSRSRRVLPHEIILQSGHTLLIPDLCWDARIHSWARLAHLPGRKIAIFHDAMPLRLPGQADSHDALFAKYVRALAELDLIICISQEVETDLLRYWREFGLTPKPTRVIPWPVPFDENRPDNPPTQDRRQIIYVARLKLRKNHLVLLDACETLWNRGEKFSLDLIGIQDAFSDTRKILRRVNFLAQQGRAVRWRKHISDVELAEAYRNCSFTAFPSRLEGFGLPIIESLWHQRPVICGRNGAIGEVAKGGGCYQLDQNNATEVADALHLLLNDGPLYQRLYEEASRRVFRRWGDYRVDLDPLLSDGNSALR